MLAEATTTELSREHQPVGLPENQRIARRGGNIAGRARQEIEEDTGKPVVTAQSAQSLGEVVAELLTAPEEGEDQG